MKSTKIYLIYASIIFGTLLFISYIDYRVHIKLQQDLQFWKWVWIDHFLYIPVGISLAIPSFIDNYSKSGTWKINYKKLIILGIPSIYFTIYIILHFWASFGKIWTPWFTIGGNDLYKIGNVILGYVLLTSFYKDDILNK